MCLTEVPGPSPGHAEPGAQVSSLMAVPSKENLTSTARPSIGRVLQYQQGAASTREESPLVDLLTVTLKGIKAAVRQGSGEEDNQA